ncbi:hypothetical protein [Chitinimonas sp.]|uniref:hypothetical protein n=1 Tax=Chitinimonas sp. TaxID=1934313 RepID=UPI0035AE8442
MHIQHKKPTGGFIAGTPVWTDRGLVPIEKICVGDMVLSRCKETGAQEHQRVSKTFTMENQIIWTVNIWGANKKEKDKEIEEYFFTKGDQLFWKCRPDWWDDEVSGEFGHEGWSSVETFNVTHLLCMNGQTALIERPHEVTRQFAPNTGIAMSDARGEWGWQIIQGPAGELFNSPSYSRYMHGMRISENEGNLQQTLEPFLATVYNITVEKYHSYFVGQLGVWVNEISDSNIL